MPNSPKVKFFEVRDRATFIPVMCIEMKSDNPEQHYLLRRAGFSHEHPSIGLARIDGGTGEFNCDPYNWRGSTRTIPIAHNHIQLNWDSLRDGDVIDVEFILKEKPEKKISERFESTY